MKNPPIMNKKPYPFSKNSSTLRALIDRLIPTDDFPSASEAGVGDYLAQHWQGDLADKASLIEAGLACLDAEANASVGADFAALSPSQQDELVAALSAPSENDAQPQTTWSVSPRLFIETMINLTAEGYYSDPGNSGNRDAISWQMLGYRSDPAAEHDQTSFPPTPELELTNFEAVEDEYDAIVVGAGAAGGIVACVLAEAGKSVLLVERGRWQRYDDVAHDHLRNHRLALYGHNTGPALEGNPRVIVDVDGTERVVAPHQNGYHNNAMSVGGGTRVYGAQAWRFLPEDFTMATDYGVPADSSLADWPITYDDLAPFYEQAEWEIGVSGRADSAIHRSPRQRDFPMPPLPDTPKRLILQAGAEKLGWKTAPPPLLINSAMYQGRPACVQCGACVGFACPSESKNGTHNTVIPRALATGNCALITETQVETITNDEAGRVTGVRLMKGSDDGVQSRTVRAKVVVSSAGAIESARLLLNSKSSHHPNGLGNQFDQVGRHLQGHTYTGAFGLFTDEVDDNNGPGVSISTCEFNHGNSGIIGGAMLANEFIKLPIVFWRTTLAPDVLRWGLANKAQMRTAFKRTIQVQGPVQEIPNPAARVQVDPRVVDGLGIPVARLSGAKHPESLRTAEFIRSKAEEWLQASGAVKIWSNPAGPGLSGGQHQAGTCRMGEDPATSVTDAWGRVHDHDNLYVIDGSLHVTNGGFNPVLTIMALAYRCAKKLAGEI